MRGKRAVVALLLALPAALGCGLVAIGLIALVDGDGSGVRGVIAGALLIALPLLVSRWINTRNRSGA